VTQPNQTRTLTALVLTKPGGFGSKARHQGHWHKANQKTEAFAINAAKHARLRNGGEAAMQ